MCSQFYNKGILAISVVWCLFDNDGNRDKKYIQGQILVQTKKIIIRFRGSHIFDIFANIILSCITFFKKFSAEMFDLLEKFFRKKLCQAHLIFDNMDCFIALI